MGLVAPSVVTPKTETAPRPGRAEVSCDSNLLHSGGWKLTPEGEAEPAVLALALTPARGPNGNEIEQKKAGEQFRLLVEPVINAERYSDLQSRFQRRTDLLQYVGSEGGKSARTVRRKLAQFEREGIMGLTRKIRTDKGLSRALNTAAREFIWGAVLPKHASYGAYSTRDIFRLHDEERRWRADKAGKPLCPVERAHYARYVDPEGCLVPSAQLPKASYKTFCRQVAQIPELVKAMARQGDEAYRNAELISYRDLECIRPLQFVVMDHRVLDIFCLIPERGAWKLGRPWLTAAIDMRTRKWLAWVVVETPSSASIATVLKTTFLEWGLPESCYWDNGRDFRALRFEGRRERSRSVEAIKGLPEKWTGVLETVGVRVHHALVRNARAKLVEPAFNAISNLDRTLPEYVGNKPGARPERFDKMLQEHEAWVAGKRDSTPFRTLDQISDLYSKALEDLNERPHTGEGMRKVTPTGMGWACPNECWELNIGRVERRTIPEDVLQLCFAKRRELTIRNGAIHATFAGRLYHYRLAGNHMALLALNDRTVEFAYDPLDLGNAAVYFENRFIGLAHCLELRRMGESDFVFDEKDRRRARREVKKFIAEVHRVVPTPTAEMQLNRRRENTPTRPVVKRVEVPVLLPASIAEAHAAQAAEAAFSFKAVEVTMPVIERPPVAADDVFDFFSDEEQV